MPALYFQLLTPILRSVDGDPVVCSALVGSATEVLATAIGGAVIKKMGVAARRGSGKVLRRISSKAKGTPSSPKIQVNLARPRFGANYPYTSKSVLDGLSKKNLKHTIRHLKDFQKLDPKMTAQQLRQIGARLVHPKNLASRPKAARKAFQAKVNIGGYKVKVRAVLNRVGKLHSIHLRK